MGDEEIADSLENGRIDIGLSGRNIESNWISSRRLYSEKICLISTDKIDLGNLEKYTWIGVSKTDYLKRLTKNKKPARLIQAGSLDLLFKFVKAGHGIAAVSQELISPTEKFRVTPTHLTGEAIYLNIPAYICFSKHSSMAHAKPSA